MSLSIEFLLKVFFLGVGVFAFNKFVIPKLAELFVKNKYKSKNHKASLDHMIRLKMNELSDKNLLSNSGQGGAAVKQKLSPKESLLFTLRDKIEVLDEENDSKADDYRWMVYLIEQIHWGDSDESKEVQELIKNSFGVELELTSVNKTLTYLLSTNSLFKVIEIKDPKVGLINLIGIHSLVSDIFFDNKSNMAVPLMEKLSVNQKTITKALKCLIQRSKKYPIETIYNDVINDQSPLDRVDRRKKEEILLEFCFVKGSSHPKNLSTFSMELEEEVTNLRTILPIKPPRDNNDIEGALRVFNQTLEDYNFSKVQKNYKKTLASCHPDRIANLNLKGDLQKNAHENFIAIQSSFEIIKKHHKKKKSA